MGHYLLAMEPNQPLEAEGGGTPQILPAEITWGPSLGRGNYGEAFSGHCRGQQVAVKVLFRQRTPEQRAAFTQEINLIR